MIAAQRRVVESLRPCRGDACADLSAHERTLRWLMAELLRRVPDAPSKAHTPLQAAWRSADVLRFEIPPSHRKRLGAAVTAAKGAFVQGLKPFHVELLRPQNAFNLELLAVVEQLLAQRATTAQPDLEAWARRRLGPVMDPGAWNVVTHRKRGMGEAVRLLKRSYLSAVGPLLGDALARQQRWNQEAVEVLLMAIRPQRPPAEECARRIAELLSLADPFGGATSLAARVSSAVWREVFRRQFTFNRELTLCLADALESRPPVEAPRAEDYAGWYAAREPARIAEVARAVEQLGTRPTVSLVVPVYETPEPILRECIESVRAQVYPHWELCLADDGSRSPHVATVLEAYARADARIRVTRLPANGGIARATNAAVAMATGEFVGFLDHDDVLAPHALGEMALRLGQTPDVDLLYSDEDRLDTQGRRCNPFFKPDWSPDLLRSVNYLCHFVVVRRSLLTDVGGLREGFEGSQDYELLLRLTEHTARIAHVPGILYHWRASGLSLSQDPRKLQAASAAGVKALSEHLARREERAEVEEVAPTHYRVRYPVRGQPLVSIIVPFKDKPELLRMLTRSLEKTRYTHYELLLVSNNSVKPETFALLEGLTDSRIRKLTWDFPFNYPAINNFAAKHARGELLLFLNNDMEIIDPGWLDELVGQAQRPEVGAVGAKLLFPDGSIQHAGVVVGITGFAGHPFWRLPDTRHWTPFGHADWTRNYLSVTSACVMLRRDVFESLGGYDERFIVCGSDVDLGLRVVERGLRVVYTPHARLVHHESASRRMDGLPENDFWRSFVAYRPWLRGGDPFYNPNLTLQSTDAGLRWHAEDGEALAVETLARDMPSTQHRVSDERAAQQRHVAEHLESLDYTAEQARTARAEAPARLATLRRKGRLERITWFLPSFHHPYGGIHTLLRFADLLRERHGAQSELVIFNNPRVSPAEMEARVGVLYPKPPGTFRVLRGPEEVAELPECDLAVATLWESVYSVLAHPRAGVRAYFIQDYEPAFYPAGTYSGLAEQTYRLGLYGIFNTRGLHDTVVSQYPMEGCWFEPTVDRDVFHSRRAGRTGSVRVFFYGRPAVERNAFELGIAALRRLKREFGPAVDIVSAGERWSPEQYGLQGVVTNLGILPYEKTADLYRGCDVGLCFMFTRHPSYLPLEMMACGVTVVTNDNPVNHWLLEHERNCLLAEPTVSCVTEQLARAVRDVDLRARVSSAAPARVLRTTWEAQVDSVFESLMGRAERASGGGRG